MAKAIVKKVPGLMKGHDTVGIDDTGLGKWNAKQANMEDHGQSEERAPAGEDRHQGGEGTETTGPAAARANKAQGEKS